VGTEDPASGFRQEMKTEPENHRVQFNSSGLSSGVYFYRIQAGDFVATKRLLLVR